MPEITVKGIPERCGQEKLEEICDKIIQSIARIEELEINESGISVFFPPDRLKRGLGEEIVITVTKLFVGPRFPRRTQPVFNKMATAIANAVKPFFPKAMVECSVEPLDQERAGFAVRFK